MLLSRCFILLIVLISTNTERGTALAQNPESQTLKILAYNIHHCEGMDGRLDVQRIADVIRDSQADIIALQEVDQLVRRSDSVDQPKRLAELLQMHVAFGANIELDGGHYGNAVLSRFPIKRFENHLLPNHGGEQRGVLEVELDLPDSRTLTLLSTHFDHQNQQQRLDSVPFIDQLTGSIMDHPVFLAGDLNAVPESPVLERLRAHWTLSSDAVHPTVPVVKPAIQIDYLLFHRPMPDAKFTVKALDTRVLDHTVASDHRGILTQWQVSFSSDDH